MKHGASLLALALGLSVLVAPFRASAERARVEGALGLSAPRAGVVTPPTAAAPAAAAPAAAPPRPLSEQEELDRVALTYGVDKATRGYRLGFPLAGVTFLLSMLWVAHPQEEGALTEIDASIVSTSDLVSVNGGAVALGAMTWLTVLAGTPAVGRAGRFARLHREVERDFTLRALGWTSYIGASVLGLTLNTYSLLETGQSKGQIAAMGILGTGGLLFLAFDDWRISRRAARIAERDDVGTGEEPHAWWAPTFSVDSTGRGPRLTIGATGAF